MGYPEDRQCEVTRVVCLSNEGDFEILGASSVQLAWTHPGPALTATVRDVGLVNRVLDKC